jgi:phosphoserine phosphatase SerB
VSQFSASITPSLSDLASREFFDDIFAHFECKSARLSEMAYSDGILRVQGFTPNSAPALPEPWELDTSSKPDLTFHDITQRLVISGEGINLQRFLPVLAWLADKSVKQSGVRPVDSIIQPGRTGALVFLLSGNPVAREQVLELSEKTGLEANLLPPLSPGLSKAGLLLMDMDSTAIQIECIDEIAALAGVGEQVSEVTELAMQGKLDFVESLKARVARLAGADEAILASVAKSLPLTPGLKPLLEALKNNGWRTAIVSGGFTYFVDKLKVDLELDEVRANLLAIEDGKLTGLVEGEIVDARIKAEMLNQWADKYRIKASQTVAAGDGANDLKMMEAAALGVAFHAKPIVKAQAATGLSHGGLEGIYYLLVAADA